MKDTCRFDDDCYFAGLLEKKEQCPNYSRSYWRNDKAEEICVHDCAPIRTMLMVQELFNRFIGLQEASEQERNKYQRVFLELANIKLNNNKEIEITVQQDLIEQ